jgi:type I restriction enzyme M protein
MRNPLYEIVTKLARLISPGVVDNNDMGSAFEYPTRKFTELSNETAGDH